MVVIELDINEKNKLIEDYIIDISNQVNSQYDGIIDDERIKRAIEMFKDSPEDLETEIIPKIKELVQDGVANAIKSDYYKQYILIKKVADSIGNITEDEIKDFMVNHYDLLKNDNSEEIVSLVVSEYRSKRKTDIPINHDVPILIQEVLNSIETKNLLKDILSNTSTIGEHDDSVFDGMLFAHNIIRNDYTIEFISQYLIIHREPFDLPALYRQIEEANICEMSETQMQQFYSKLLLSSIAKRFAIEDVDSLEAKQQIYNFIYQNYIENGYCFQGLNNKYKDSVIQNGLSSKFSRQNTKALEEIDKIFEKHGLDKIFYSKLSETNLAPYFYITDSMSIAYHYSYHNPEWFAYFVAAGNDMPDSEYDKTAYYRRDYDACKSNLTKLCKQYNLSIDETKTIIDSFNGFWSDIVSEENYGTVAFVQRKLVNRDNVDFNVSKLEEVDAISMISELLKSNYKIDVQHIDIPPEKIDVIDVPGIVDFYDKERIDASSKRKYIKLENSDKYYYDILIHADEIDFDCISITDNERLTMETKKSAYGMPIDIISCNNNINKDSLLENGNTSFQNLEMMIAVNGIANSEEGKKLIEKARSDYSPEYMKNYYYHLSHMFCNIAMDDNYSIQDRASVLVRMAKDIYPKAYIMDKTGNYPQFINEDKKVFTYLDYRQRLRLKEIEKMRKGENVNPKIIEEFSSSFKNKLEGKINKNFTPEFNKQISMMKEKQTSHTAKENKSTSNSSTSQKSGGIKKMKVNSPAVKKTLLTGAKVTHEQPKGKTNSKKSELNKMLNSTSSQSQKQSTAQKVQPKVLTKTNKSSPASSDNKGGSSTKGFVGVLSLSAMVGIAIGMIIGLLIMITLLK